MAFTSAAGCRIPEECKAVWKRPIKDGEEVHMLLFVLLLF